MKTIVLAFVSVLLLSSCAHHRDVRPGDDGVHRVVVQATDTEEGAREAVSQANHFCEKRKQYAVFLKEEQKYTGDMDEQTYKNARRATKVAQVAGGAAWVFGGKRESTIGGITGVGASAANAAIGEGYNVEMQFRCK